MLQICNGWHKWANFIVAKTISLSRFGSRAYAKTTPLSFYLLIRGMQQWLWTVPSTKRRWRRSYWWKHIPETKKGPNPMHWEDSSREGEASYIEMDWSPISTHTRLLQPTTNLWSSKIHKDNNPLRPIISTIGSPTYRLAKELARTISPLAGKVITSWRTQLTLPVMYTQWSRWWWPNG